MCSSDLFAGVLAAGHAEAKLKIKALEQFLSKIVPFNHPEVLYGHVANCELHTVRETERETVVTFKAP